MFDVTTRLVMPYLTPILVVVGGFLLNWRLQVHRRRFSQIMEQQARRDKYTEKILEKKMKFYEYFHQRLFRLAMEGSADIRNEAMSELNEKLASFAQECLAPPEMIYVDASTGKCITRFVHTIAELQKADALAEGFYSAVREAMVELRKDAHRVLGITALGDTAEFFQEMVRLATPNVGQFKR